MSNLKEELGTFLEELGRPTMTEIVEQTCEKAKEVTNFDDLYTLIDDMDIYARKYVDINWLSWFEKIIDSYNIFQFDTDEEAQKCFERFKKDDFEAYFNEVLDEAENLDCSMVDIEVYDDLMTDDEREFIMERLFEPYDERAERMDYDEC